MDASNSQLNLLISYNTQFFGAYQEQGQKLKISIKDIKKYLMDVEAIDCKDLQEVEAKLIIDVKEHVQEIAILVQEMEPHTVLDCNFNNIKRIFPEESTQIEDSLSLPTVQNFLTAYHVASKISALFKFISDHKIGRNISAPSLHSNLHNSIIYFLNYIVEIANKTENQCALKTLKVFYEKYPFFTEDVRLAAVCQKIAEDKQSIHSHIDLYQLGRKNRVSLMWSLELYQDQDKQFNLFMNELPRYHFTKTEDIISVCRTIILTERQIKFLRMITQDNEEKRLKILNYCLEKRITILPVFEAFYHTCLKIDEQIRYKSALKSVKNRNSDFQRFCNDTAFYNITDEKIRLDLLDKSSHIVGSYYHLFQITDPKKRYEHAYEYCTISALGLKDIKNFNIPLEEDRFKLALAALEHAYFFFDHINEFELTLEHQIELIKLGARKAYICSVLKKIKIDDEELRLQIALEKLLFNKACEDFSCFEINDLEKQKKLAEAIVQHHKCPISTLKKLGSSDLDLYPFFDLAIEKKTFNVRDLNVIAEMNFSLDKLYMLLEKGITKLVKTEASWQEGKVDILTFGLRVSPRLRDLCELSAGHPGFALNYLKVKSFEWTEEEIFEILLKAINKSRINFLEIYPQVKIESLERRMQLAEVLVQHTIDCVITFFGIEDESKKKKLIALQAQAGNLRATERLFRYGFDNAFLLEMLLLAKPYGTESANIVDWILARKFTRPQLKQITQHFVTENLYANCYRIRLLKLFGEGEQYELIRHSLFKNSCSYLSVILNFSDEYKRRCIKILINEDDFEFVIQILLSLKDLDPVSEASILKKHLHRYSVDYIEKAYEQKLISIQTLMDIIIKKAGRNEWLISRFSESLRCIYAAGIEKDLQWKFTTQFLLSQLVISSKKYVDALKYLTQPIHVHFPDQRFYDLPDISRLVEEKKTDELRFLDEILPYPLKALATSFENIDNPYLRKIQSEWFVKVLGASYLSLSFNRYIKNEKLQAVLQELALLRNPELKEHITRVLIHHYFGERKSCLQKRKTLFSILQTIRPNAFLAAILMLSWSSKVELNKLEFVIRAISKKRSLMKDVIKRKLLLESLVSIMKTTRLSKEKTVEVISNIVSQTNIKKVLKDLNFFAGVMNYQWGDEEFDFTQLDHIVMKLVFKDVKFAENESEGLLQRYEDTFGTHHNPHAIMIYSSKHQQSEDDVKEIINRYIRSILFKTFHTERYALEGNAHLSQIFSNSPDKLIKWRTPRHFKPIDVVNAKEFFHPTEKIDFKEFYVEKILQFKHLGENQEELYPELIKGLQGGSEERKKIILSLKERLDKKGINDLKSLEKIKLSYEILNSLELSCNADQACKILDVVKELISKQSEFYNDLNVFSRYLKNPITFSLDDLEFKICDDPSDLMQCGTDVGSCQRYDGDVKYNKCLPAYLLDGKYQIAKVKSKHTGKILGRAMLRLLWDQTKETGVIHQEKVYYTIAKEFMKSTITKMSIQFAEDVGFDLVTSSKNMDKYPHTLHSLDSPAPYEYVDGAGGVKSKKYKIRETYYLK